MLASKSNIYITKAKPFLKWVGGKRQLLADIIPLMPQTYTNFFEPFLGGGALTFAVDPPHAFISDCNEEIINCYRCISSRQELSALAAMLDVFARHFNALPDDQARKGYYLELRDIPPNELAHTQNIFRAARTIFLNRTCFNGLYRVNKQGKFNVPFGKYKTARLPTIADLIECHRVLEKKAILFGDFDTIVRQYARSGDFVYLDPPYVPVGITSNFTSYTNGGFGIEQHENLLKLCEDLDQMGVMWMQSNSVAPWVIQNYRRFNITLVEARRAVNCKATKRGTVQEVLIRNYA